MENYERIGNTEKITIHEKKNNLWKICCTNNKTTSQNRND